MEVFVEIEELKFNLDHTNKHSSTVNNNKKLFAEGETDHADEKSRQETQQTFLPRAASYVL